MLRLWHQLTTAIHKLSLTPAYTTKPAFLLFHSSFIYSFRTAIAPLAYAELTARAAEQTNSAESASALLTKAASDVSNDAEASLLIDMEMTRYDIRRYRAAKANAMTDEINDADDAALEACRDRIEAAKKRLDSYAGVMDAKLFSLFYRTSAEFDSAAGLDSEFFTDGMLFMTYQNVDALSAEDKLSWAKQLALSAIKGKSVYNYGELTQHRIVDSLRGGPNSWMISLITALNAGDMSEFNSEWNKLPNNADTAALKAIEPFLREKLTILALIELLFQRAPSNRVVTFADIAAAVKAPIDRVEFILMKALALGVIRGIIDASRSDDPRYLGSAAHSQYQANRRTQRPIHRVDHTGRPRYQTRTRRRATHSQTRSVTLCENKTYKL